MLPHDQLQKLAARIDASGFMTHLEAKAVRCEPLPEGAEEYISQAIRGDSDDQSN